ncbi:hypothetical protein [Aliiroseovarius sp. PrR006]|nr:hypothetical protein [Aliiroseovarius sp. PrR006]NDW53908.1 hypothetical protein [Aliiroseovarius sp. PrR006]
MKYGLPLSLVATPALAHGDEFLHFHASDMLGLALSVLLITVVWKLS